MADSDPKSVTSLSEAVALVEASAFRITPKFVYGYKHKDGNPVLGLVPVHIKHANVWKYIDDLVDPEPGTLLANTVIGEIPKHYKAANDLILKDPSKTLKDVLTKEGQSHSMEPLHAPGAPVPAPVSAPVPVPAAVPASPPAPVTKADVQALGGPEGIPLQTYLSTVSFNKDPSYDAQLLKNTAITSVLLKVYGANWKDQAAALGYTVPGMNPIPPVVANAAKILKLSPGSEEFKALQALHKHGNDVDATVALAGGDDASENAMIQAAKTVNKIVSLAKKADIVSVTSDEDDDDVDVVKFKPMAASPMLVPAEPPPPVVRPPVPVAPPPKPVPAGYAVLDLKALQALPNNTTIENPEGFGFQKIGGGWYLNGYLNQGADLAALDGQAFKVNPKSWKPAPAPAPAPPPSPPPSPKAPDGFVFMTTADLKNGPEGITIQDPVGNTFTRKAGKWHYVSNGLLTPLDNGDAALAGTPFKVVPPVSVTPAVEPIKPTATQTAPITTGGLKLPAIPPLSTLSLVGDAKASMGGAHPKKILKDGSGNTFLLKTDAGAPSYAAEAYSKIAAKVFGPENAVPVLMGNVPGVGTGSVQPIIPNVKTDLGKVAPKNLTHDQLARLMQERVLDWALASHDAKAGNFLLTTDGNVVGIDKDQALKFIGADSLDTTYKPNPSPQLYGTLFDLYKQKLIDLPIGAMLPAIEKIEAISDETWLANLGSYLGAKTTSVAQLDNLKKAILARKKNTRKDLEAFLTGVLQERGDIGLSDTFDFERGVMHPGQVKPKKKKKKDLSGISTPPPMGSILSPPPVPSLDTLTPQGAAMGIGGAGEKYFFAGPSPGEKWLIKLARSKDKTKDEPFRIAAQQAFSQVANVVRPGKSVPVGDVPGGYLGVPASIQPWIEGASGLGAAATKPSLLTDSEKKDVAEEHALDWLMSQHDTHAANFVRRPDGALISIDKEQGFKYMMPGSKGSPDGDKLSTEYHPNGAYGQSEPFYNKFWRSFAEGSMDFDPAQMKDAISRIEGINDTDYTQLLSNFAGMSKFKDDPKKVAEFLQAALLRKQGIRKDFEQFIGGLYEKRTKQKGTFSFAGGWNTAEVSAPAPTKSPAPLSGVQPQLEVDITKKGALGASGVALYKPTDLTPPEPPALPKTPPGYPDPPAGKMWAVKPTSLFFSTGPEGNFYKTKPPKGADGAPDASSKDVVVKLKGLNVSEAEDALKQLGASPISVKAKGGYVIAMMTKEDLAKAQASPKGIGLLVDLPPPPPPPSGKGTSVPKPGVLQNVVIDEQKETTALLKNIAKDKLSLGKVLLADGNMIEHNSMMVQRHKDPKGKDFYQVAFKLRAPVLKTLVSPGHYEGKQSEFEFPSMTFDPDSDTWLEKPMPLSGGGFDARKWEKDGNNFSVGTGVDGKKAMRGEAVAQLYLKPNQTVEAALTELLNAVQPDLGEALTKPPSKNELDVMKLSALLWSAAPQTSDSLPEEKRTVKHLRETLKSKGYKDEELDSIRLEKVGFNGRVVPVLPGRSKKILAANPDMKYLRHGFGSVDKVVKHLLSGSVAVGDRLHLGVGTNNTTSGNSDINTGGADYLFTKPGLTNNNDFAWGGIQTVVDPSELDRLDIFSHGHDAYGTTSGASFENRDPLESSSTQSKKELMVRHGFSPNKIIKIRTQDDHTRAQVIQGLKAAGVTSFNGMSLEDLVVSSTAFYKDHLKPAGY